MKLNLFVILSVTACSIVLAVPLRTIKENSSISAIVIPYAPYTTDVVKNSKGKMQKVFVPVKMDIVPKPNIKEGQISMGSQKGTPLNFAEGAYPVYYMPGSVNGKFQDKKIYLLE